MFAVHMSVNTSLPIFNLAGHITFRERGRNYKHMVLYMYWCRILSLPGFITIDMALSKVKSALQRCLMRLRWSSYITHSPETCADVIRKYRYRLRNRNETIFSTHHCFVRADWVFNQTNLNDKIKNITKICAIFIIVNIFYSSFGAVS